MNIHDLIFRNRSYRRFDQNHHISLQQLRDLVELARISGSAANRQPVKFMLFNNREGCDLVFPALSWAGYFPDWDGPEEGERPSAYIVMLGDKGITNSFCHDTGIFAQSMLLGAVETGLGGCMIASIKKDMLRRNLGIDEKYEILLVLALGKPAEKIVLDPIRDGDIKYWRDNENVHHVPKRSLDELIINN